MKKIQHRELRNQPMYTELRSVGIRMEPRLSISWNHSTNTAKDAGNIFMCFLIATYVKWVYNSWLLVNQLQVTSYFFVFFLHSYYEFVG